MLIDRILKNGICNLKEPSYFKIDFLKNSMIINADNIANYVFSSGKELWNISDFPNIAPVNNSLWIEYTAPIDTSGNNTIIKTRLYINDEIPSDIVTGSFSPDV